MGVDYFKWYSFHFLSQNPYATHTIAEKPKAEFITSLTEVICVCKFLMTKMIMNIS